MALKNLSKDIESAIENAIEGLGYSIDIEKIPADRLGATMESKVVSFLSTKKLISSWENSLNAPNNDKLRYYIEKYLILCNTKDFLLCNYEIEVEHHLDYKLF